MVVTIITSIITAGVTSIFAYLIQESRLRTELKTEFMAEEAVKSLLESKDWEKRSFKTISKRLKGFEGNELRKILIRSGAVCFHGKNDKEVWGLRSRNIDDL